MGQVVLSLDHAVQAFIQEFSAEGTDSRTPLREAGSSTRVGETDRRSNIYRDKIGKKVKFRKHIRYAGRRAGLVRGEIQIAGPDCIVQRMPSIEEVECCSIN